MIIVNPGLSSSPWRLRTLLDPVQTSWLLGRDNPSVRYLTLRDLLGYSSEASEIEERSSIWSYDKVSKILKRQNPNGHWESEVRPYHPKYKST